MDGSQVDVPWQLKQLVPVGIWLADLPEAVAPSWQEAQLVLLLKPLWSGRAVVAQVEVLLWHDSQLPVTLAWIALLGLAVWP